MLTKNLNTGDLRLGTLFIYSSITCKKNHQVQSRVHLWQESVATDLAGTLGNFWVIRNVSPAPIEPYI